MPDNNGWDHPDPERQHQSRWSDQDKARVAKQRKAVADRYADIEAALDEADAYAEAALDEADAYAEAILARLDAAPW